MIALTLHLTKFSGWEGVAYICGAVGLKSLTIEHCFQSKTNGALPHFLDVHGVALVISVCDNVNSIPSQAGLVSKPPGWATMVKSTRIHPCNDRESRSVKVCRNIWYRTLCQIWTVHLIILITLLICHAGAHLPVIRWLQYTCDTFIGCECDVVNLSTFWGFMHHARALV